MGDPASRNPTVTSKDLHLGVSVVFLRLRRQPLSYAVGLGDSEPLRALLNRQADPNAVARPRADPKGRLLWLGEDEDTMGDLEGTVKKSHGKKHAFFEALACESTERLELQINDPNPHKKKEPRGKTHLHEIHRTCMELH